MEKLSHSDVLNKLKIIFLEVFGDDIELSDVTTASDVDEWDSLTNVRLIVLIEQEFNITFNSSIIADIQNVGELIDLILGQI